MIWPLLVTTPVFISVDGSLKFPAMITLPDTVPAFNRVSDGPTRPTAKVDAMVAPARLSTNP